MSKFVLSLMLLVGAASTAAAWNDKGHMTVARLAWKELTADERAKVIGFLKSHPHFGEFLKAQRPDNIPEDEWVFLRAATWADWVRSHHARDFSKPKQHYSDTPFVAAGSGIVPPKQDEVNAVSGINGELKVAKESGDQTKRAVALTWLFHLTGDIHQPLHAISYYSADFPTGDRGGNLSTVKIAGGGIVQLHHFWDGLLGTSTSRSSILGTVKEVTDLAAEDAVVAADLKNNKTPESWAKESFETAKKVAYEDGDLKPANTSDHPHGADIPTTSADYAEKAGETARLGAYKGGKRLAQLLREVIAAN